jgi:predicted AlkP superfamily phosphohydrolase/phosphomutase
VVPVKRAARLALFALAAFAASARAEEPRLLLIGWDGADWTLLDPLLRAGRLPNLAGLMARGRHAGLQSDVMVSPVTWTTIATGKHKEKHGVLDWTPEGAPPPSGTRKVKALWNILGERGVRVGLAGYMVTWPAEKVNGRLVSKEWLRGTGVEGGAWPEEPFAPRSAEDVRAALFDGKPAPPAPPPWSREAREAHLRGFLRDAMTEDLRTARAADALLAAEPFGFFATHFWGMDWLAHPVYGEDARQIAEYAVFLDGVIGGLLARAGERTTVLVVSDHGLTSLPKGPVRSEGQWRPTGHHSPEGILVIAGPAVRPSPERGAAAVADVAPTVLRLFGAPVAEDMDGRALEEMLDAAKLGPARAVPTYETGERRREAPSAAPPADRRRLRELGYIK